MVLERFTIRDQILVSFAVITTISVLVISGLAIANVNIVGNATEDESSNALESQITRNMQKTSAENAQIIERKFKKLLTAL